jgi:hypothetical protein
VSRNVKPAPSGVADAADLLAAIQREFQRVERT